MEDFKGIRAARKMTVIGAFLFTKEVMPVVELTPILINLGKIMPFQPYDTVAGERSYE